MKMKGNEALLFSIGEPKDGMGVIVFTPVRIDPKDQIVRPMINDGGTTNLYLHFDKKSHEWLPVFIPKTTGDVEMDVNNLSDVTNFLRKYHRSINRGRKFGRTIGQEFEIFSEHMLFMSIVEASSTDLPRSIDECRRYSPRTASDRIDQILEDYDYGIS